jgi:hypothetical protein
VDFKLSDDGEVLVLKGLSIDAIHKLCEASPDKGRFLVTGEESGSLSTVFPDWKRVAEISDGEFIANSTRVKDFWTTILLDNVAFDLQVPRHPTVEPP